MLSNENDYQSRSLGVHARGVHGGFLLRQLSVKDDAFPLSQALNENEQGFLEFLVSFISFENPRKRELILVSIDTDGAERSLRYCFSSFVLCILGISVESADILAIAEGFVAK